MRLRALPTADNTPPNNSGAEGQLPPAVDTGGLRRGRPPGGGGGDVGDRKITVITETPKLPPPVFPGGEPYKDDGVRHMDVDDDDRASTQTPRDMDVDTERAEEREARLRLDRLVGDKDTQALEDRWRRLKDGGSDNAGDGRASRPRSPLNDRGADGDRDTRVYSRAAITKINERMSQMPSTSSGGPTFIPLNIVEMSDSEYRDEFINIKNRLLNEEDPQTAASFWEPLLIAMGKDLNIPTETIINENKSRLYNEALKKHIQKHGVEDYVYQPPSLPPPLPPPKPPQQQQPPPPPPRPDEAMELELTRPTTTKKLSQPYYLQNGVPSAVTLADFEGMEYDQMKTTATKIIADDPSIENLELLLELGRLRQEAINTQKEHAAKLEKEIDAGKENRTKLIQIELELQVKKTELQKAEDLQKKTTAENSEIRKKLDKLKTEFNTLNKRHEDALQKGEKQRQDVAIRSAELDILKRERLDQEAKHAETIQSLKSALNDEKSNTSATAASVKNLERQLRAAEDERKKAQRKAGEKQSKAKKAFEKANEDLTAVKNNIEKLKADLTKKHLESETLTKTMSEATELQRRQTDDLERRKEELEEQIKTRGHRAELQESRLLELNRQTESIKQQQQDLLDQQARVEILHANRVRAMDEEMEEKEKRMRDNDEQYVNLQKAKDSLSIDLYELSDRVKTDTTRLTTLQETFRDLNERKTSAEDELRVTEDRMQHLKDTYRDQINEQVVALAEIQKKREEAQVLMDQDALMYNRRVQVAAEAKFADLRKQADEHYASAARQLAIKQTALDEANASIALLEHRATTNTQYIENLQNESAAREAENTQLAAQLNAQNTRIDELNAQLAERVEFDTGRRDTLQNEINELQRQKEAELAHTLALQQTTEIETNKLNDLRLQLDEMRRDDETSREEIIEETRALREHLDALALQLSQSTNAYTASENRVAAAQERLQALEEEAETAQRQHVTHIEDLMRERDVLTLHKTELTESIQELETKQRRFERQLQETKETLQRSQSDIDALAVEYAQRKKDVLNVNAELVSAETQIASSKHEQETLDNQIASLRRKLTQANNRLQESAVAAQAAEQDNKKTNDAILELTTQRDTLLASIDTLKTTHEETQKRFREEETRSAEQSRFELNEIAASYSNRKRALDLEMETETNSRSAYLASMRSQQEMETRELEAKQRQIESHREALEREALNIQNNRVALSEGFSVNLIQSRNQLATLEGSLVPLQQRLARINYLLGSGNEHNDLYQSTLQPEVDYLTTAINIRTENITRIRELVATASRMASVETKELANACFSATQSLLDNWGSVNSFIEEGTERAIENVAQLRRQADVYRDALTIVQAQQAALEAIGITVDRANDVEMTDAGAQRREGARRLLENPISPILNTVLTACVAPIMTHPYVKSTPLAGVISELLLRTLRRGQRAAEILYSISSDHDDEVYNTKIAPFFTEIVTLIIAPILEPLFSLYDDLILWSKWSQRSQEVSRYMPAEKIAFAAINLAARLTRAQGEVEISNLDELSAQDRGIAILSSINDPSLHTNHKRTYDFISNFFLQPDSSQTPIPLSPNVETFTHLYQMEPIIARWGNSPIDGSAPTSNTLISSNALAAGVAAYLVNKQSLEQTAESDLAVAQELTPYAPPSAPKKTLALADSTAPSEEAPTRRRIPLTSVPKPAASSSSSLPATTPKTARRRIPPPVIQGNPAVAAVQQQQQTPANRILETANAINNQQALIGTDIPVPTGFSAIDATLPSTASQQPYFRPRTDPSTIEADDRTTKDITAGLIEAINMHGSKMNPNTLKAFDKPFE